MSDTFTMAEVTDLLTAMLLNIRAGGGIEDGTYSLQEVARRCHVAPSSLVKDCRAGRLEHVGYGESRSMTPMQVAKFLTKYTQGGDLAIHQSAATDEMAEARAASRSAAKRQPRRSAA